MEYHNTGVDEVLSELKTGKDGLSSSALKDRQEKYGRNVITVHKPVSFFVLFLRQFKNYLVWLLIFIAAFAFFTGFYFGRNEQIIDGVIISFIVLLNSSVGAFQEYKSEKAAELLKSMLKNEAVVVRDGKKSKIDSSGLVPGDIILLKEGDKVPADCRIVGSDGLKVDESMLTGESVQVNKDAKAVKGDVPLADRRCMVFMNTYVTRGAATCVVTGTGKETEVGKIAKSLDIEQDSIFLKEVDEASKKITYVAITLIAVVLAIYYLKDHHWISIFLIGAALVIGSIPEGLPAIVTFALSMGSSKLAKEQVLVKRKTLLETLGSVDVICTDKTGTLTENRMAIKKLFFDGGIFEDMKEWKKGRGVSKGTFEQFRNCAILANEAKDTDKGFLGDAEDVVLMEFFSDAGIDVLDLRRRLPAKSFEPFSSETKYARSCNVVGREHVCYTKGAPEVVLKDCGSMLVKGKLKRLTDKDRKRFMEVISDFSGQALRNIAFSYRKGKTGKSVLLGVVGIYDPPKKDIDRTVKAMYDAGIEMKMITGDNVETATAIAKECGFRNIKAISWEKLKGMSDDVLKKTVKECNVFARMSPDLKLKIVSALQENGNRVAITGDGVNDVPALKKAEVGISMGKKGSDIAKEAADLILLDDDIASVVKGIKEGRTIFSNIRKVINYLLTANLAEVLVVFIGSMMGLMPFLAIQLLWVNFVTDIAPAMALGVDPSHKDIMKKKPTGRGEKLINKRITLLTIGIGVKKVVLMFLTFYITYRLSGNLALAQTMSFTWLVFSHFVRVAAIRFDEGVSLFVNKYVNWSVLVPVIFQLIIIYTGLSVLFHVVPLSVVEWVILVTTLLIAVGLAKVITYVIDKNIPATEKDY